MARTRQQAKQRQAKRREKEQRKAQGTTGQKPPSNPAEQAAVQQAEAYEVGDVLEESGGDSEEAAERLDDELSDEAIVPVEAPEPTTAPEPAEAPSGRSPARPKERPERKPRKDRGAAPKPQRPERKREPRQRGRLVAFFIQVWAELRRVQWPDRTQVTQATAVVVVFCILAGLYLALFDRIFSELVKVIL
jgi:preprotein translocase SecE subunit